jgi:hypothetical protein
VGFTLAFLGAVGSGKGKSMKELRSTRTRRARQLTWDAVNSCNSMKSEPFVERHQRSSRVCAEIVR